MREPVDLGPDTQPSLEARPDPHESLASPPPHKPLAPTSPLPAASPKAEPPPAAALTAAPKADAPPAAAPTAEPPPPDAKPPDAKPPDAKNQDAKSYDAKSHATPAPPSEPLPPPAQPVLVPAQYHYLKRPAFVLVLLGTWIIAALVGLGLFEYWFHAVNKPPAVFCVLLFVIACALGAQLLAMVQNKPLVSATAIAVMSAPFAATAAAAALHGSYIFHWLSR